MRHTGRRGKTLKQSRQVTIYQMAFELECCRHARVAHGVYNSENTVMLKRTFISAVAVAAAAAMASTSAFAGNTGTADEAVAMVKKAAAAIKKDGGDKVFAEVNAGGWKDRDLYPMIYNTKGVNLAHGANPKLIGKDLSELTDADGVKLLPCLWNASTKNGGKGGWCDYKWPNPITKEIQAKSTYVEKVNDIIVGVGIYK